MAVTPDGTVYALDGVDSRLYRLRPGARTLDLVMRLDARAPSALVAADDRVLYVATGQGLLRVDTASRAAAPVKSAEELTGLDSLAWRGGSSGGPARRRQLSRRPPRAGFRRHARPAPHGARNVADPTVGTLARDAYYYLL